MTIEQAIELLTSYRNGWIDADLFNRIEIDEARNVVRAAGYEWTHNDGPAIGWKLIKSESN